MSRFYGRYACACHRNTLYYPDITAVCETPLFDGENPPSLLNPALIIEVASPSTRNYDIGEKFAKARQLTSLQEYVVIAQEEQHVQHYVRQQAGQWLLTDYTTDMFKLESVASVLSITNIYENVP